MLPPSIGSSANQTTHVLIVGDLSLAHEQKAGADRAGSIARNAAEFGASVGLFGVDEKNGADEKVFRRHLVQFLALLPQYDVIVFADYPQSSLDNLDQMITAAKVAGKRILVQPNAADFPFFSGVYLLASSQAALIHNVGPWESETELTAKSQQLRASLNIDVLLCIRLGGGITLYTAQHVTHYPAMTGADEPESASAEILLAAVAVILGSGVPVADAVSLANRAAFDLTDEG